MLSQTEVVRRSALDVLCMPQLYFQHILERSVQRVQMISERALKGQTDKLYFCTSLAPSNVIPSDSLALLIVQ